MVDSSKPDYSALDLLSPPADRPYVLINMVMSADGKVVIEGTERGLGSSTDQRLMRELRVNADVVLNGASTLRASGTSSRLGAEDLETIRLRRGKTRQPIAAVLSRSGDLPLASAFFTRQDFDAIVYLSDSAGPDRRKALSATGRAVHLVPAGEETPAALRHMRRDLGAEVLLVEGGPNLNGNLFARDLVDEFFLTLAPLVVNGRRGLTAVEGSQEPTIEAVARLDLVAAVPNPNTGELYLRYRTRRSA